MFVWFYLNVHLKSFFIASVGISIIILSFPVTAVITTFILQITYFGSFHIIIIYIILGIGADDIFVVYDAWQQSATLDKSICDNNQKRMAYTFRRSGRAILITSSTTSVAFFGNAFSNMMPIRSFGIFAGVIVPVNYVLVILFMPPALIWY